MNKRQKIVQQQFIGNEERIIKRLKSVYGQANKDIAASIANLDASIDVLQKAVADITDDEIGNLAAAFLSKNRNLTPEEAKKTLQSMLQSKVYQRDYQRALNKQVGGILNTMRDNEFKAVSDYLQKCYEDGFVGTMYDLHGQGIPLCFPLDQEAMVRAVQLDSKISQGLYSRLGEDVPLLKKKIIAQVSRGIATGMSYQQVAQQLAGVSRIGYNNAVRIARTEGHRIEVQAAMDACGKAAEKGADVVKQWDSTLDARTRESHMLVDGEIRELNERFSNGLMFPGDPSGGAAEVVNCRCALLQRARWALTEAELAKLKERAAYYGLDKTEQFDDFKRTYLKMADESAKIEAEIVSDECKLIVESLEKYGVDYKEVMMHETPLSESEIITALSGGDRTQGSCASVGLAYCGQKGGMNVLDFRDGKSRAFFSTNGNLKRIAELPGVVTIRETAKSAVTAGNKLLKQVVPGKEYYFVSGRHAAIVRKTDDGVLQYLELQSAKRSGWTNFNGNPRYTLKDRFGDYRQGGFDVHSYMIEVDSIKDSPDLKKLLGYINTAESEQRKGIHGTIK